MSTTLNSQGRNRPPTASPRHTRRRATALVAAASLLVAGASAAIAQITTDNDTHLAAVGPISGEHGYPTWYEDSLGLRLEQCLDLEDPFCDPAFLRDEMPDPDAPISFPDNWPLESFYFLAGAEAAMPGGGDAILTAGLEATMANEASVDGDQVVFGRLRFDIDFPGAGTYAVTHPYGVDTFTVTAAEADGFRYVEDITPAPGNFGLALRSRINPFLVAEGGPIEANGNLYVGDPAQLTAVTGSPHGTNLLRVERVDNGVGTVIAETDQFSLMGKVSTNSGVTPQGAFLVENANGRYLEVFATTDALDSVSVSGDGILKTTLVGDGDRYFGRIPLPPGTTAPASVTFTNESDKPVATQQVTVTDRVTVTSATYDTGTGDLTVSASSSDEVEPPTLSVEGVTMDSLGTATITTTAPPATVTVSSTGGGSDSAPVTVIGAETTPAAAPLAVISGPTEVLAGSQVTLTSASQNATQLLWSQTEGATVGVTGRTDQTVTFTAPLEDGTLAFTLTATGPGGTHTAGPFEITVMTTLPDPVAKATATPNPALVGQKVTLSSAGTTGAQSYAWSQVAADGDPTVDIATPTDDTASFTMPAVPVTFQLLATSPDGEKTATATVTVNPLIDILAVTAGAQYRADKSEWRISGTATVTNSNTVSVYLRNTEGGNGALIGTGLVDALGDWQVRVRNSQVIPPAGTIQINVESSRGGTTTATVARR